MDQIKQMGKLALALGAVIALLTLKPIAQPEQSRQADMQTGQGVALQPPMFAMPAHAADLAQTDLDFLPEEAGVTAYANLNQEIDLEQIRHRFSSISQETDRFIKGIVRPSGYEELTEIDERADIHVFLHRDGWVVGYLTKWQEASMLFDWVNYETDRLTTLAENVIRMFATDLGVSDYNVSYYDFRYPEATNLLLAVERLDPEHRNDFFEITISRGLTIYEISWSLAKLGYYPLTCMLNDDEINVLTSSSIIIHDKWTIATGELDKTKLLFDTTHRLSASFAHSAATRGYCGIAIIYQEVER